MKKSTIVRVGWSTTKKLNPFPGKGNGFSNAKV